MHTNGASGLDDGGSADGGVAVTSDLLRRALTARARSRIYTGSLGTLRAPASSWRPFGHSGRVTQNLSSKLNFGYNGWLEEKRSLNIWYLHHLCRTWGVAWSGLKEFSLSRGKCVEYGSGKQEGVGHHQIVVLILHNHPPTTLPVCSAEPERFCKNCLCVRKHGPHLSSRRQELD